jgi:hypothetical protein
LVSSKYLRTEVDFETIGKQPGTPMFRSDIPVTGQHTKQLARQQGSTFKMTKTIITALIAGSLLLIGCGGSATEAEPTPVAETVQPTAAPPAEPAAQEEATDETPATDAQPTGETAPAPAAN